MKLISASILVLLSIGVLPDYSNALQKTNAIEDPLQIEPVKQTLLFQQNQIGHAKLYFNLPKGYHGYVDSLKFQITNLKEANVQDFELSPTVDFFDKFSNKHKKGFTNRSELTLKILFSSKPKNEQGQLNLQITYQACTDTFCLLPKKKNIEIPYAYALTQNQNNWFDSVKEKNIMIQLLLIFMAGILTSLTPCIFPMIPITLSVLGTRTLNQTRKKSFFLSLIYVFGIAVTYSIFGFIAAKTGSLFGSALTKPWVVLAMAAIFYSMAISMFGFFDVQIPAFVQTRLNKIKFAHGYFGAFLYGLIAGVVASPCIGPVLVGILAHVARLSNPAFGILFLFTYALGMGVLFIVLGSSSHLLNKIPKAGPWMNMTKFIFGISMIGLALFYIHSVFSERVFLGFVCASVILVTSVYGAFDNIKKVHGIKKIRKWVMVALFCLAFGIMFKVLFADWATNAKQVDTLFKPYSEIKLEEALAKGQPVIIDFFAEWCIACKELDKYTYADNEVKSKLIGFLLMKVDATTENDEVLKVLNRFKIIGMPTVIFYNSKGQMRPDLTLTGFEPPEDFLKRINSLEN